MSAYVGTLLVSAYLVFSAWWCLPVVCSDAHLFMGTAVRYAQGHGLTNPAYRYESLDKTGMHRVLTYPPLFHWAVGAIMPSPDPRWAFLAVALMRVLQIIAWAWILYLILQRLLPGTAGRWLWSLPLLQGALVSEGAGPMEGRPEALVGLLHSIGVLLLFYLPLRWHSIAAGVVLGLIGASHPVGVILSSLGLMVYATVRLPTGKALTFLFVAAGTSLATALAVFAASNVGAIEVIQGAGSLFGTLIVRAWGQFKVLLIGGRAPLCGLMIAAGCLAGFALLHRHRRSLGSPVLAVAASVLFCTAIWYFGIRAPDRFYNAAVFAPFFLVIPFVWGAGLRTYSAAVLVGVACFWGVCSLGMVRYAVLAAYASRVGVPVSEAVELLAQTMDRYPGESIRLPEAGLVLVKDFGRARLSSGYGVPADQRPEMIMTLTADQFEDSNLILAAGYREIAATRKPSLAKWSPYWCGGYSMRIFRRGDLSQVGQTQ